MDYKKIIKNQQLRFKILRALSWVPDSLMLRLQYRIKMGFWPNLDNPKRYTEKIQLYKMKYRNPVMHQCVDKYEVRKFVESKGLGHLLNELYGVYDSIEDINFDILPDKFVIKNTVGGGGQNVIIVRDKTIVDWADLKRRLSFWSSDNNLGALSGREWAYKGCKPRYLIEKLLEQDEFGGSLIDYKFFCFNGEPQYLYVLNDRKLGENVHLSIYTKDFKKTNYYRKDEQRTESVVPKPNNFNLMIDAARKLSTDFPHVRVDFYNINGNIIFGELTFYDGSGYFHYDPDEFDIEMGHYFSEYGI